MNGLCEQNAVGSFIQTGFSVWNGGRGELMFFGIDVCVCVFTSHKIFMILWFGCNVNRKSTVMKYYDGWISIEPNAHSKREIFLHKA